MKKQNKTTNVDNSSVKEYANLVQDYTAADKTARTCIIRNVPQTLDALRKIASDEAILQACIKQAIFHTLLSKVRKQELEEIDFALSIPRAADSIKAIERAIIAAVSSGDIAKATELSLKLAEAKARKAAEKDDEENADE